MKLLILVHPGSLCGSANFNLGRSRAAGVRRDVIEDLLNWDGALLVLDGELSDELSLYPALDEAIEVAAARSAAGFEFGVRLTANDPEHSEIAARFLTDQNVPLDAEIVLTGAWYDPQAESGCVYSTLQALRGAGYGQVSVLESAASLEDEVLDDELDAEAFGTALATVIRPQM